MEGELHLMPAVSGEDAGRAAIEWLSHPLPARETDPKQAAACAREQELSRLIRCVAEEDQGALEALYDATSRLVYSLVLRIRQARPAAEDVTIEVYLRVYPRVAAAELLDRSAARLHEQPRRRSASGAGIARSLTGIAAVAAPGPDPEASSLASETQRMVRRALAALTPEQRHVVEMAYFGGLSQRQIATKLGEPLGTVKSRIRTAMPRLRALLGPLSIDAPS